MEKLKIELNRRLEFLKERLKTDSKYSNHWDVQLHKANQEGMIKCLEDTLKLLEENKTK